MILLLLNTQFLFENQDWRDRLRVRKRERIREKIFYTVLDSPMSATTGAEGAWN